MRTVAAFATVLILTFSAGHAFAESEGNTDQFTFSAKQTVTRGPAFVADANAEAYPVATGNAGQESSLAQLEPAGGSEAIVQTATSMPVRAGASTAVVQSRPAAAHAG